MCGRIRLIGAERIPIAIYTINGILIEKIDKYTGEDIFLDKGIYIVSVENKTLKIISAERNTLSALLKYYEIYELIKKLN